MGNKEVNLTDVCDFKGGTQPPKEEWINHLEDGYVRMLQIRDFTQNKIEHVGYVKNNHKLNKCKVDDILIGRYGASIGKILTGNEGAYNVAIIKTIPNEKLLLKKYLYYVLTGTKFQNFILNIGSRAAQAGFNKDDLSNFKLKLPSLDDQFLIANLLSKSEAFIKQRKESIDLLDEYLRSAFLDMFGDPVRNEKNWTKRSVCKYTDCIVPGRDKPKSFTGTTPWFTTADLIHKGFVIKSKNNLGLSDFEINEVKAKSIPVGSVIMTCVGDLGVVSINKEVCVVNQQLHAFLCKPQINNIFLMYNLSFMTSYMYKMASTTTVPYMNKTICNSIPVILPNINLQTKFANIVEKAELLKAQYQSSLSEFENLYGSLSQKAFKGELNLEKGEEIMMAAEQMVGYGNLNN